jgi:predicted nucleotidyltransferase
MYKLTSKQLQQLKKVADSHELTMILLHGSQTTELTHDKSDIDIAVVPQKNVTIDIDLERLQKVAALALSQFLDDAIQIAATESNVKNHVTVSQIP